ncbi:dTMP kinase [Candidatus Kaiserbacteria bacterium RIFCSPHIGHO2_02_FULL_59_21]|uniref:Thymidylate kinase n=1 Tax=Candidatus Kaiserbacteria bacterium RIFCSPHIGHO2_02_FULL_59_21 TaxID=1798500 RepID=A0A1F6E1K0_9BACT|nr:MAG: dTMP kinase [Candidatus Kaiserbacteria bacterium RIFCSPHIGHO2_01_FULL_58_22]OGG67430.1 MAG: dTMP kinase [Candidatus Kaiserbacteria bacterium RIFCSPHIGHO2_02_FULL_59_21]OGG80690.1 MAG: dTMP kinase [Candidatus Kaiserbacteria bacterium RIFCSPLOWO2_01_FULL_59_34]OGG85805.1 MAG: dTMP kinase [Candidatus Kaiserbacteria bacterium RIFCSPLOWO2_02_FULL_59_19]
MTRGKFVVLEGGEGAGKSVQMGRIREILPHGVFTRDPGGVETGEDIRRMVLSKEARGIDAATEILLFLAARAQLIAELIAPALESGKLVVCDRFILSTIAYQAYGRKKLEYLPLVKSVFEAIHHGCVPDLTIFLEVSPEVGLARARARLEAPNRFDEEEVAFHERVREGYKKHLNDYGKSAVVNADNDIEQVWQDVREALQSAL